MFNLSQTQLSSNATVGVICKTNWFTNEIPLLLCHRRGIIHRINEPFSSPSVPQIGMRGCQSQQAQKFEACQSQHEKENLILTPYCGQENIDQGSMTCLNLIIKCDSSNVLNVVIYLHKYYTFIWFYIL